MGEEESSSKREKTVRKALAKKSNLEFRKRKRGPGNWGDLESLVCEAEYGNQLKDWRTSALAVVCYFGRLGDVIRVKGKDVIMEKDKITVWMRKQKTDKLNEGDSFCMVAMGNGFSIRRFLESYISSNNALFPKNVKKGARSVAATYAVMYQALEGAKEKLGLDTNLILHSFRIGSATRGTVLGVRRSVGKGAGKWHSGCVDLYCREEDPGVVLSRALVEDPGF